MVNNLKKCRYWLDEEFYNPYVLSNQCGEQHGEVNENENGYCSLGSSSMKPPCNVNPPDEEVCKLANLVITAIRVWK